MIPQAPEEASERRDPPRQPKKKFRSPIRRSVRPDRQAKDSPKPSEAPPAKPEASPAVKPPSERVDRQASSKKPKAEQPKTVNEGKQKQRIAVVDLFAGLRTVHVAGRGPIDIVLALSSREMRLRRSTSEENQIKEVLHKSVKALQGTWAVDFIKESKAQGAKAVLVIGGFPCKDLSRAKGGSRENLEGTEYSLFFEIVRIIRDLRKAASGSIQMFFPNESWSRGFSFTSVIGVKRFSECLAASQGCANFGFARLFRDMNMTFPCFFL